MLILPIAILSPGHGTPANAQAENPPPALEVLKYDLAANQGRPELCFRLSESLARSPSTALESFVAAEPTVTLSATPRKDRLCLAGFAFGTAYTISLKAGLPGITSLLPKDVQFRVEVPNRPPELDFAAAGDDVLPKMGGSLPIRSVNIPKIDIQLFRIADDNLLSQRSRSRLTAAEASAFAPTNGERVWQGSVDVKGDANSDCVTMLPIEQNVGTLKPGLYVAVAKASGAPPDGLPLPTQYFAVSDFGLSAYRGPDSLLMAVRSLSSGSAVPGIDVALVAANNRELGRLRTDGNGFARFDPSLLRGAGGDRPALVLAYGAAGELATLDLGSGTSKSSSRPTVALIRTDRPIYRTGESVNILALLRNDQGVAVTKLPLSLDIIRPSGNILARQAVSDLGAGSYNLAVTIPKAESRGIWHIVARTDGEKMPVGQASFEVESASPSRLTLALNADVAIIDPAQPSDAVAQAQYPDGQATNIPGELDVIISPACMPFPAFPDFSFGLSGEDFAPVSLDPIHFTTDPSGKASLPIKFMSRLKSTRPLEALVTARLYDDAGRAVDRAISIPIATQNLIFGVKADTVFPAGQSAHFDIIAVSPDGARQEKVGAGWEILRQDPVPSWSWNGQRFAYRPAVKDSHIAGGTIDIPSNGSAILDNNLAPGRYRIEIFDPDGEAITSRYFAVGWAPRADRDATDTVAINPVKPYSTPGETADIFVQPPFDADVVLSSADPQIRETVVQHVAASGATMHLPIPRDVGLALQLQATAVAPPDPGNSTLTRRALGNATLLSDPGQRALTIKLDLPDTATPQQALSIPVAVAGAGDEAVYIRLSAIDERPDADRLPYDTMLDPLIAYQMSAVSALDNYSRIITPSGLSNGALAGKLATYSSHEAGNDPDRPGRMPLALYSGVVTLDKSSKGNIALNLPDFAGKLKVKALAWSASRTGQSDAEITVRYPLNATLPVPAFLAPEDHADVTLALDNADGPRGEYRVTAHAEGAVSVQDETEAVFNLAEHEQRSEPIGIQAHGPGEGAIILSVKGPNGIAFQRRLPLTVRPLAAQIARYASVAVKAGGTFTIDQALTAAMRPETLNISLTAGTDLDLPAIAKELRQSGRDSVEQVVDAAMADLTPSAMPVSDGSDAAGIARLNEAVALVAGFQGSDGGFSLFGTGPSDLWLTAYAVDFLSVARSRGAVVPDVLLRQALDYLALRIELMAASASSKPDADPAPPVYTQQMIGAAAYAAKMLAANGRLNLFELRYFADRFRSQIRNPVTAGLIAAAFAHLGDKVAAAAAFAVAGSLPIDPPLSELFGSDLRDQAMLTALMAESGGVAQSTIFTNMTKTAAIAANHRQLSQQEAGWILRANATQPTAGTAVKLKVGDKKIDQNTPFAVTVTGQPLPTIKNSGDAPIRIAVAVSGSLTPGDAKDQQAGYELERWFFDLGGKPIDPAALHQGDLAVVVLTGRFTGQGEAHPLLSDLVAAGWEIDAAEITDPIGRYPWLKDLTGASHAAAADGRYVAVPRLAGDRHEFKLAYVIRAAVRGQFNLPGPVIEDMALPALSAHAAAGRAKVDPPS